MKWNEENIKNFVESQNYRFIAIINKKAGNSKILIQCPSGHIFYVCFKNFKGNKAIKGTRCPACNSHPKPTLNKIKNRLNNYGFTLLSKEYINAKTKLKIQCSKGHIFYRTWTNLNKSDKIECPICLGGRESISINLIKDFLKQFNYELLSDKYINAHEKLLIKCNKGHIFKKSWNKLKNSQKCPICGISKGEEEIMNYLNKNKINYIYNEPYFSDLLSSYNIPLRPDFIIPDKKIWIEYDGEFHYRNIYNDDSFERLKTHDEMKDKYAKEHNWKLIRIPYWEFKNINKILNQKLNLE